MRSKVDVKSNLKAAQRQRDPIPLFLPLELKVFRLASQFVKCSLGVVALGRSLFLPDIELAKY